MSFATHQMGIPSPVLNPKKRAGANVSGTGVKPPSFDAIAAAAVADSAANESCSPSATTPMKRTTLTPQKPIKVSEEKQALLKSRVFSPLQSPDSFQWSTTMRGTVGKNPNGRPDQIGTSFGNRVAVMPENSSKPGDQAMNLPPRDAHVQIDAYSSSLVKDIIFGGKGDALPMSAAAAAASNDPLVESTRH